VTDQTLLTLPSGLIQDVNDTQKISTPICCFDDDDDDMMNDMMMMMMMMYGTNDLQEHI